MSGINSVSGRADIAQVLADMRNLRAQVKPAENLQQEISPTKIQGTTDVRDVKEVPKFNDLLSSAVDAVNTEQQKSGALQRAYEAGDPSVSITQVMIQSQKSSVSFEALTQVRNRVVKAYEDIMKMPI
jgi:flagellar hook-basal body complex protein FliE